MLLKAIQRSSLAPIGLRPIGLRSASLCAKTHSFPIGLNAQGTRIVSVCAQEASGSQVRIVQTELGSAYSTTDRDCCSLSTALAETRGGSLLGAI